MSDDSDNFVYSDSEIDDKKHEKLVETLLNLNKIQHIKKPARSEPSLKISEFDLVKSVTGNKGSVQLTELTKALKGKKLAPINQKVHLTKKKGQTLPKPLEKPQAERIKRAVNYEKSRLDFDKWEAMVTSNRAQIQQVFPLESAKRIKLKDAETMPERWRIKSELQKELDELEPKVEVFNIEKEEGESYSLTLAELKEKRKETAKLRARQGFIEAKARQQNKIKSKKYHRILRRERIKEKLKEFEELQKTNPEEALKKLEDIEKARAQERFSLRHKSTGQWAKSKQIRAKYDKQSRQALAQQLAVSRDLTQKLKANSDSEDEGIEGQENVANTSKNDPNNPWVSGIKPGKEVADFVGEYRSYWNEKNQYIQKEDGEKVLENVEEKANSLEVVVDKVAENSKVEKIQKKKLKKPEKAERKKEKMKIKNSSGEWQVGKDIDELFDELENRLNKKAKKKSKKVAKEKSKTKNKKVIVKNKKVHGKNKTKTKTSKLDLSIPKKSKKQIIDEEMIEQPHRIQENNDSSSIDQLQKILDSAIIPEQKSDSNVDPNKYMNVKSTNLDTAVPDILVEDENIEETTQRNLIMEAFEDDDIVKDFDKEKKEEIDKDKPKNIDLNLPGWGSWAGAMINPNKRKRKRFIIRMPEELPRKDKNKGLLIINETAQAKIREYQVSDIPFPFKSVKDYEASIRAPIGSTFLPQTAFKKLIQPAVITKMGTIIEPMKKSMLLNNSKR